MLTPVFGLAQAPIPATSPPFAQGHGDRQAWESWFNGLNGQYKVGAEFWAGQRSLPHPAPCFAAGGRDLGAWTDGCVAAQRLLGPSDARRKNEPDYRLGWNSFDPTTKTNDPTEDLVPKPIIEDAHMSPYEGWLVGLLMVLGTITAVAVRRRTGDKYRRRASNSAAMVASVPGGDGDLAYRPDVVERSYRSDREASTQVERKPDSREKFGAVRALIALECPSCGAPASEGDQICSYCRVALVAMPSAIST
jgi:hypothetical protein